MPPSPAIHIVLHEPEIPQNTGNIGRTCVALAAKLWLVRPVGFRLDDHHVRRAGLDYWEHLNLEIVDHWEMLTERLAGHRFWYFSRRGKASFFEARFAEGDVLVFGSESKGLPESFLADTPERALRMPMTDQVRSLNLSNCVAVAAYEVTRQRTVG